MEELIKRLNAVPDTYFAFETGIISYANKKPERLEKVLEFLRTSQDLMSSDIIKFISDQPDFHEDFVDAQEREQAS